MNQHPNQHLSKRVRRGFTLIEVVTMVLVLAIAVPPTLEILMANSATRANVINTGRATMLASNILEGVLADVSSNDPLLGFDALADSNAYLNTPTTGFYDRMSIATVSFTDLGLSYTVSIGELVASDGLVSMDSADNIFRTVTVVVGYPSADGPAYSLPVSIMVSTL